MDGYLQSNSLQKMTEFILLYLFFASCMFAAAYSNAWEPDRIAILFVSLLWPWFLVTCLFQRIIN